MRQFRSNKKAQNFIGCTASQRFGSPYLIARCLWLVYIAEHALGTSEAKLLGRIIAFGIVLVLVLVAVLGVLTFVGMEFITNAVG
jgi:hypothetical protein